MKIRHEKPVDWVDTSEQGVIQPSHVAGLEHVIEIEPGDFVQGPQGVKGDAGAVGPQGVKGDTGAVGPQGIKGDTGAVGPQGVKGDTGAVGPQGGPGPQGAGAAWPAGAVMYFAMLDVPPGWLACDGTYYQQADYPALCSAIGATYGGDGVTGFSVPDLRGEFLRCLDAGRGVESGRQIGSWQEDCNREHSHNYQIGAVVDMQYSGEGYSQNLGVQNGVMDADTMPSGGGEARPRNVALLACISTGQ